MDNNIGGAERAGKDVKFERIRRITGYLVGTVDRWENGVAHCQQRGKWSLGDTLEALCPDGRSIPLTPEWIENEAGERVDSTPHAMEKYTMPTPELPPMSLLRRKTV